MILGLILLFFLAFAMWAMLRAGALADKEMDRIRKREFRFDDIDNADSTA